MENHENNGHGNSHDDSQTEGNKQYYPRGWWLPLVGLVTVALGFTLLGGFVFSVSGTDKWGKTEQCDNEKCCADPNCKGDCKDEGKEDKKPDAMAAPMNNAAATTDTSKADQAKKGEMMVDTAHHAAPAGH